MHCPFCRHTDSRVMDSRATDDGSSIRRRRQCPECGKRFTTVETAALSVVKRSGATEPSASEVHFPLLGLAAAELNRRIRWSLTESAAEIAF